MFARLQVDLKYGKKILLLLCLLHLRIKLTNAVLIPFPLDRGVGQRTGQLETNE